MKADPVDWLLEEDNPSARCFALTDILDRPENDPEVRRAKREIMLRGAVPEILMRQRESAYRDARSAFYTDKYAGLVWSLIALAELGAEADPQIREQCEYLLDNSQEVGDGGFAMHASAKKGGGRIAEVIPCLTGNMVWSLIRFGYLDDPRLQKAVGWITRFTRLNDGVEDNPQIPPYDRMAECWGAHTCFMGVVKMLKGLSAIPEERRTAQARATIDGIVEFLLIHHIHRRSRDLSKTSKPGWLKFGFPLMYQTDALEILDILTGLGVRDARMGEAVDSVIAKRDGEGRWRMENTSITDKLLVPFERKGEQSKWITIRALRVLKRYRAG